MNSFADEAKYDISNVPAAQIASEYEEKRTDAWSVIENLGIVKRIVSVCKFDDYTTYVFCLRGCFLQQRWSRRRVLRVRQVWGAKELRLRRRRLPTQTYNHVRYHRDLIIRRRLLPHHQIRFKRLLRLILHPTLQQVLRLEELPPHHH